VSDIIAPRKSVSFGPLLWYQFWCQFVLKVDAVSCTLMR
jgi:hypothetical protein